MASGAFAIEWAAVALFAAAAASGAVENVVCTFVTAEFAVPAVVSDAGAEECWNLTEQNSFFAAGHLTHFVTTYGKCWEVLTGFCRKGPGITCCIEPRALACPESKLEPDCSEFNMVCCAVEAPDRVETTGKEDKKVCCKLVMLLGWIVGTEPCKFIGCNSGLI